MGLSTLLLYRSHYRDARALGEPSPLAPIGVNLSCPRQAPPTVETPRGASPKRHRRSRGRGPIGREVAAVRSEDTGATAHPLGFLGRNRRRGDAPRGVSTVGGRPLWRRIS